MLTIEDIRNLSRKSGFDHVGTSNPNRPDGGMFQAKIYGGNIDTSGLSWRGPKRKDPAVAAQDYCDYMNLPREPITIEDIRNPARKSGFDHVGLLGLHKGGTGTPSFQARGGYKPSNSPNSHGIAAWHGPRRPTAEEAAQDYCDYVNGRLAQPSLALKRPSVERAPRKRTFTPSPELSELRRKARELENKEKAKLPTVVEDTYLIGERGSTYAVKIGKSKDQEWRPAELQTGNPRELYVIGFIEGGGEAKERQLQQKYIKDNVLLEWFKPSPQLFDEFGVDYFEWEDSLRGQIEAPERIAA